MKILLLLALLQSPQSPQSPPKNVENEYFRVTHDAAPCASAGTPGCADRVLVALGDLVVKSGGKTRTLKRGEIAVFKPGESYERPTGSGHFYEVALKPNRPAAIPPPEIIAAEKNETLYDGKEFHVFQEQLGPHDTRARHSHTNRVVIQLNPARIHDRMEWPKPDKPTTPGKTPIVPDMPTLGTPKIHVLENVSDVPLRGVVIELKITSSRGI